MSANLRRLLDCIAAADDAAVDQLLEASPALARESLGRGATREESGAHFIAALECYAYQGDTALHFAAAAYRPHLIRRLIDSGAEVDARNRRGAAPLHYAAVG